MFSDYNFKYYNYRLVLYMLSLSVIGILVVASASNQDSSTVTKQIIGVMVGFALAIGLSIIDIIKSSSFMLWIMRLASFCWVLFWLWDIRLEGPPDGLTFLASGGFSRLSSLKSD
uniref:hypothetical protein n=1 Tax=Clostridium sp. NkU-1 TaxID=1095009 RepID=UPI0032604914